MEAVKEGQSRLQLRERKAKRFNVKASGRGVGWDDDAHDKQWPFPVSDEGPQVRIPNPYQQGGP